MYRLCTGVVWRTIKTKIKTEAWGTRWKGKMGQAQESGIHPASIQEPTEGMCRLGQITWQKRQEQPMQMKEGCGIYGVNFWFCMTIVSFTGIFALFTRRGKLIEQEGAEHSKRWQTNLTHNVFLPKCHTLTSLSVPSGCSFPLQLNFLEAEITSRRKTLKKKPQKKCSLTISSSSICLNTLHNSPGYLK